MLFNNEKIGHYQCFYTNYRKLKISNVVSLNTKKKHAFRVFRIFKS